MGAPSESFVDPSIAGNSGSGTIGAPWGDLQYGFNQVTRDASNGDRFNIKEGTDEILTASLSLTTYGAPAIGAPLILQGYTSAAGDGGIGGISGDGTYGMWASSASDAIMMVDLHMHNCGSAMIILLDNDCVLINCELNNTTNTALRCDANGTLIGNYVHDIGTLGLSFQYGLCAYNRLVEGVKTFTTVIDKVNSGNPSVIAHNILDVGATTYGIVSRGTDYIFNNTIFAVAGQAAGIYTATGNRMSNLTGNYIEGFSAGGVGILTSAAARQGIYGGNAIFNCTTPYSGIYEFVLKDLGGNLTLSSSALTDPANGDFTIKDSVIVGTSRPTGWLGLSGNVQGVDIGAVQRRYATLGTPGRSGGRQG